MKTSPISMLLGGFGGLVMGTLCKYRALPFLKEDTMLRGGKQVSTAEFATLGARWFYIFAGVCLVGALIWFIVRARKKTA